jgi:DNA-binding transcriptional LysR family regulator
MQTTLNASVASTSIESLIDLAETGYGIACVPDFSVASKVRDGALVAVLDEYVDQTGTLRAVWPTTQYLSPCTRAFIDFMASNLFPCKRYEVFLAPSMRTRERGAEETPATAK